MIKFVFDTTQQKEVGNGCFSIKLHLTVHISFMTKKNIHEDALNDLQASSKSQSKKALGNDVWLN